MLRLSLLLSLLIATSLFQVATAFCGHGTRLHPRNEEFEEPAFDYGITRGPLHWHTLQDEFAACATGTTQSPILLTREMETTAKGDVKSHLPIEQEVELENLGSTVEIKLEGELQALGRNWTLAQCHFHLPSEHRVKNNRHHEAEMHCVHSAADESGEVLVLSFLLAVADWGSSSFLHRFTRRLYAIPHPGDKVAIEHTASSLHALQHTFDSSTYLRYTGSLTTPPCSEGVNWFVATEPLHLQVNTYQRLKELTGFNSRFIQNNLGSPNLIELVSIQQS